MRLISILITSTLSFLLHEGVKCNQCSIDAYRINDLDRNVSFILTITDSQDKRCQMLKESTDD